MDKVYFASVDRACRLALAFSGLPYLEKMRILLDSPDLGRMKASLPDIDASRERMRRNRSRFLLIGDEAYPDSLYEMGTPPLLLHYRGDISLLKRPCLAMVGSRDHTAYGEHVAKSLSREAVKAGAVIVSGGARGIDSVSHTEAIYNEGKTICVLGCGLDVTFPPENGELFREIAEKGLILSEYPLGFRPKRWTFPMRNRIIAALSGFIVVVEAKEKSGSLHTASYGEEWNRKVYAVPGDIRMATSRGCNLLIQMGALPMLSSGETVSDFLAEFPESLGYRLQDLSLLDTALEINFLAKITGIEKMALTLHLQGMRKDFTCTGFDGNCFEVSRVQNIFF
ncbi:MAG TPA: DNA-processing protein DprA [Clostridiaceae bacterium]|nr:DNA-processing protein DprA [Clostridiaceae bacterium]